MSLLLEAGHPEARHYPLGMLYDESNLVIERRNASIVTDSQLRNLSAMGVFSKKARTEFSKQVKLLNVVTKPLRRWLE